jgi:hypothetical protein
MAAGNLAGVKSWMNFAAHFSNVDLSHRNTSGETFLHVSRIQESGHFITYLEILKVVIKRGFDFSIRDHSGRTIAQRLHGLTDEWDKIEENQVLEAGAILGMKKNPDANDLERDDLQLPQCLLAPPIDCDTPLLKRLRQSPSTPIREPELQSLVRDSEIHMRERRGYTALAVAARLGLRDTCHLLLENGANPNTRSYQGTSVIAHATIHLTQAQQKGDNELYSRILSCLVLLTDHGAKPIVSDYDEFSMDAPKLAKRKSPRKVFENPSATQVVQRKTSSTQSVHEETPTDHPSVHCVDLFELEDSLGRSWPISELGAADYMLNNNYAQPATSSNTSWDTSQAGVQQSQYNDLVKFRASSIMIDGFVSHNEQVSLSTRMFDFPSSLAYCSGAQLLRRFFRVTKWKLALQLCRQPSAPKKFTNCPLI